MVILTGNNGKETSELCHCTRPFHRIIVMLSFFITLPGRSVDLYS